MYMLGSPAQGCDVSLYMSVSEKSVYKYVLRWESSYLPE